MKHFNQKDFNLKEIIKDRVNKEAEVEWANTARPSLPTYKKCEEIKMNTGWINLLKQLRP